MALPDQDVANFLAGQGLGLTVGTNLFWGPERAEQAGVPRDAVFVFTAPGGSPERNNDPRVEERFPVVHVRVRDGNSTDAETLARQIQDSLQGADISGYLDVEALGSSFMPALETQSGLYRASLSFRLIYTSDVRP